MRFEVFTAVKFRRNLLAPSSALKEEVAFML
jgi:hypothetical protein